MPRIQMFSAHPSARLAALAALLAASATAPALAQQMYRCTGANGRAVMSDRPCSSNAPQLQQYGSLPETVSPSSRAHNAQPVPVGDVKPHHQDLPSGACKDLSEALRTGPARGVGPEVMRNLRKEWDQRCRDEDAQAWQAYNERQQRERQQKDLSRMLTKAEQEAERDRQDTERQRCQELKRILAKRRERTGLTPGEQADLKGFEASYQARCGKPN